MNKRIGSSERLVVVLLAVCIIAAWLLSSVPIAWAGDGTPTPPRMRETVPTRTPTATPTAPPCGPTEVTGGIIDVDTIWYQACSPFTVTGNILVDSGVTLTIEAGVTVKFASGKALQVNGTLVARGTSGNPIVFTSNATNPAPGDWVYLFFADSSTDATLDANGNYVSGSIFEYCEVRYGGGTGSTGAVQVDRASPLIDHCTISNSGTAGVSLSQSNSRVRYSTITNNRHDGISTQSSWNIFTSNTCNV